MKYTFTAEEESLEELKPFLIAYEMQRKIDDAVLYIRTQVKHTDLTDHEHELLERIREILFYE